MPFSGDKKAPAPRFRPGPGQIGAEAAMKGLRGESASRQRSEPHSQSHSGVESKLGFPEMGNPNAPPEGDYRHVLQIGQYTNIHNLGRKVPFGVWSILNGHAQALMKPGQVPYDVLEDS